MSKFARYFMAVLALICVLIASTQVLLQMSRLQDSGAKEAARKEAIGAAKQAVDSLYYRVLRTCEREKFALREEVILRLIDEQNGHGKRLYAFDATGLYIAHYNRHYLGHNAYLEQDANGRFYMSDLGVKNGGYVEAKIPWQSRWRHIITYVREDAKSGVIIGATVDLTQIAQQPSRSLAASRRWLVYGFDFAAMAWLGANLYFASRRRRA